MGCIVDVLYTHALTVPIRYGLFMIYFTTWGNIANMCTYDLDFAFVINNVFSRQFLINIVTTIKHIDQLVKNTV